MSVSTIAAQSPAGAGAAPATVPAILAAAAAAVPDRPAIRDSAGCWTYAELDRLGRAVAGWLTGQGVGPGDRVLVRLPNTRETVALLYGVTRIGAALVPISPAMKDFHLRSVLGDCGPTLAIADDRTAEALQRLTAVPVHGVRAVFDGLGEPPATEHCPVAATPDDVALLMYTSGSTAAPKGVVSPHSAVLHAAGAICSVLGLHRDDVIFSRLPLPFDYGLYQVLLAGLVGAEVVLSGSEPEFTLLARIVDSGATVVPVVPSLASALVLLAQRDPVPSRVRMFTNTGAALPQVTIDALRAAFPGARVVRMYGTTECKRVTVMPPDEEHERPGSVGPALPGTQVVVVDEHGQPVPPGTTGEITVIGPHVMAGYWRAPELSARTFRRDERTGTVSLHTGDYGSLDADGYVYFDGRRDDMFKRKGVRMSTIEIEAAAMDVPGVNAACVLVPTEKRDLVICVAGETSSGTVLRELAKRLESAKVPAVCHVLEDFPLTSNGKNARQALLDLVDGESW